MSMSQDEKQHLANRVVEILKVEDPMAAIAELKAKVDAGDEGEDGLNSTVLAIAVAMAQHLRR